MTSKRATSESYLIRGFLVFITLLAGLGPYILLHPTDDHVPSSLHTSLNEFHHKPSLPIGVHYHVVFSTSCTDQQHWESYVFYYHALRVRQSGTITRIASGCNQRDATALTQFHNKFIATMSNDFKLHLTPDFSRVRLDKGKFPYKYMNKPYGLRHWMEHALGLNQTSAISHSPFRNDVVILMDPDMILLEPITHQFRAFDLYAQNEPPRWTLVRHGHPMAQQDGYLDNAWMKLNASYITDDPNFELPPWNDGPKFWNTGPPYLATVRDMYGIAKVWTETAPRVLDVYPQLFAEMFGFIYATVMLKLPFTLVKSIVVSTTTTSSREGWKFVDDLPNDQVCSVPRLATSFKEERPELPNLPVGLHYCKRYYLGDYFFSKYRVKKNILNCDKPLFGLPPDDIFPKFDYMITPPRADLSDKLTYKAEKRPVKKEWAKREAFMLCGMMSAVNEALRYFKSMACGTANLSETYSVYTDPTNH